MLGFALGELALGEIKKTSNVTFITARSQWQMTARVQSTAVLSAISKMQMQARLIGGFNLPARAQFQQKMMAPGAFGVLARAQWQQKARVQSTAGLSGIAQWQMKMQAPGPTGIMGRAQWQMKAQVQSTARLSGRVTWQWKAIPGLSLTVFSANLVVIDEVYGSDAITRINMPIVSTIAKLGAITTIYISAGARILNSFDVLQLVFTKPDGSSFVRSSNINIGNANFFSNVGRLVPNTYAVHVLEGTLLDQKGTWQVELRVNTALSAVGFFGVQ